MSNIEYKKGLAMPYMGSKRKLAKPIIDFILNENPNCKYIFDLFGGGGAVSFEAMQRPQIQQVHYNELNTGVVELLKDIRKNGVTDKYYQWIDRQTFIDNVGRDNWFGGFLKCCWSFGNNQKNYLYGKKIEQYKKLLHFIVVDKCLDSTKQFKDEFKVDLSEVLNIELLNERRLFCRREIKKILKIRVGLQHLEQLQRLEHLQRLQHLERLNITNLSYEQVIIDTPIDETVIYLDPPYKNTAKYEKDTCHKTLRKYVINSPYKIYVSSYEWEGLNCVLKMNHKSTLSRTNNSKKTSENLYINRGLND